MLVATSKNAETPLALVELPSPPLGPTDLRVRVRAIGVNPVDWKMRSGGPLRFAHRFLGPSGPLVVGVDFAGEVIAIGARVSDVAIGDRVVGGTDFSRKQRGSYASEVIVRADQCAALPPTVSYEQAACLPVPGATAWRALKELGAIDRKPNSKVLVLGASGGVGLASIQVARALGASVVGVCSGRNVALVERLGAVAIDYTKGDALDQARAHGPFEVIVHAVGTDVYPLGTCRSMLTRTGKVTLVVVRPADYPCFGLLPGVCSVLGRPSRAVLTQLVQWVAEGRFECLIESTRPLSEAEDALAVSRAGKVVGKLLLTP